MRAAVAVHLYKLPARVEQVALEEVALGLLLERLAQMELQEMLIPAVGQVAAQALSQMG